MSTAVGFFASSFFLFLLVDRFRRASLRQESFLALGGLNVDLESGSASRALMDAEQARAHAERGRALLQRLNHLEAISDPPAVDNFTSSPCGTTLRDGLVEEERKPPPFVSARARAPPAIAQMESGRFVEERELWVPGVGFCSAPAGRWKRCDDAVRRSSTQGRTAQTTEKSHRFLAVAPPILDGMGWRIDVASGGAARACDDLGWERCRR